MQLSRRSGLMVAAAFLAVAAGAGSSADPGVGTAGSGPPGTAAEPTVTLRLTATATRGDTGARITIRGTFRGRAHAGRRTYRLLPVGDARVVHRHGAAAAQRARIDAVFLDAGSDSDRVRVVATATLVGGPAIPARGDACERVALRYVARPPAGSATVRWACRGAGSDRSPPLHLDVLRRPAAAIASTYTIVRRPCTRPGASAAQASGCRSSMRTPRAGTGSTR